VSAQYNTWTKLNDVGMGKRERATGFSIGSMGYVCGGMDTAEVIHKDLWAYDPQNDTWSQKADLPGSARRDAISFVINNYAFVGSGMDSVSGPTGTKIFGATTLPLTLGLLLQIFLVRVAMVFILPRGLRPAEKVISAAGK
jgi:N-acetylneuraminic acid mutarotase